MIGPTQATWDARRYSWKPSSTFPISSGWPRSATASENELWYLSRESGFNLSWLSSSALTLT